MDLCITRIGKKSTLLMRSPCCRYVRSHCISGKKKHIPVSSGTEQDCMSTMGFYCSSDQISGDNTSGLTVNDDYIHHFCPWVKFHFTVGHLSAQSRISS